MNVSRSPSTSNIRVTAARTAAGVSDAAGVNAISSRSALTYRTVNNVDAPSIHTLRTYALSSVHRSSDDTRRSVRNERIQSKLNVAGSARRVRTSAAPPFPTTGG